MTGDPGEARAPGPGRASGADDPDLLRRLPRLAVAAAVRGPWFRSVVLRAALRLEGGGFRSATARDVMSACLDVEIGSFSYGDCFVPGAFPPRTRIGRYVSVAEGVVALGRNHPMDRLSMHPYFYNADLGLVKEDNVAFGGLEVGADTWLGLRAILTPGVRRVGIGAVVAAGAVVTADVPDFAVVAGVPARVVRFRFPEPVREAIRASRWWVRPLAECAALRGLFERGLDESALAHPFLRPPG